MCNSRSSTKTPFRYGEETKWKKVDKCLSGLLCFINGNSSFRTLMSISSGFSGSPHIEQYSGISFSLLFLKSDYIFWITFG
jgi:hypothetical protein